MSVSKKKGLGRGLGEMGVSELLSGFGSVPAIPAIDGSNGYKEVDISLLNPGVYQPRRQMDPAALEELANSIESQGIIQPIVVRKLDTGYEIIAGERRWRAAQKAGLTQVPVIIRDLSDQSVLAIALIENIQRQDLNAMEESFALNRLIEEFQMTHQEVAKAVGRSRAAVTNILRLLKLEPEVRQLLEDGKLDMGHARALLSLEKNQQLQAALTVVAKGLSVRQTEQLIQGYLHKEDSSPSPTNKERDANVLSLERDLADKLGARVQIQQKSKQKGNLIISYSSLDELDGILEHIK
jgi:ParB family transcriptional regulator, chromosome partitioning protein